MNRSPRLRRMGPVALLQGALLAAAALVPAARAEPYLAVREGFRCSQCHLNPTGGGKRTAFGSIYERTGLSARMWDWNEAIANVGADEQWVGVEGLLEGGNYLPTALTDRISIGADFRTRANRTFGSPTGDIFDFAVSDARLYLQADLHPQYLSFYLDETVRPGTDAREIYGLLRTKGVTWKSPVGDLPLGGYVKAGRLLPPFGWRLQDNAELVRQVTGYNYSTPDDGVEVGSTLGPGTVSFAVTNGNGGSAETDRRKQAIGWTHWVWRHVQAGGSIAYNDAADTERFVWGAFGGVNVGRFTVLAEADIVEDRNIAAATSNRQLATYLEFDYLLTKGVNVKTTFGYNDPDRDIGDNARNRFGIGIEAFPAESMQLSLFWRANDAIPQDPTSQVDNLFLELHLFL